MPSPHNLSRRDFVAASAAVMAATPLEAARAWVMTPGLPLKSVGPAAHWLMAHYGDAVRAVQTSRYTAALLCAIACQESGYVWYPFSKKGQHDAAQILRLMVLDNVSPRCAFPRNTDTFRHDDRVQELLPMLIAASDASRVARGIKATGNLLYGYGIFQYDLQNILDDKPFWQDRPAGAPPEQQGLWGDFEACAARLIKELDRKFAAHPNDRAAAIAAYNGSGPNAKAYAGIILSYERAISAAGI